MNETTQDTGEIKPHWQKYVRNTAGEHEQEMFSRKENLMEFFSVMTLILVDLWLIAYSAVLLGIEWLNVLSMVILVAGALFLFFVSPNLHKDEFTGWGLGNPLTLFRNLKEAEKSKKIALSALILGLIIGLTVAVYVLWIDVADFLGLDEVDALAFKQGAGGSIAIIGLGAIVAFFFCTICIRYDNFLGALKTAFLIIIPLAILMLILGPIINGIDVLMTFDPLDFALNVFGYIFWGFIQQLLFIFRDEGKERFSTSGWGSKRD